MTCLPILECRFGRPGRRIVDDKATNGIDRGSGEIERHLIAGLKQLHEFSKAAIAWIAGLDPLDELWRDTGTRRNFFPCEIGPSAGALECVRCLREKAVTQILAGHQPIQCIHRDGLRNEVCLLGLKGCGDGVSPLMRLKFPRLALLFGISQPLFHETPCKVWRRCEGH